jgi:glycosyltransferase involved in cell wall biosynthesis
MPVPAPQEVKICALIPAYNEAGTIASVVAGARQYTAMVAVVDDGSTDGTAEAAEAAGAVCLRHRRNEGKGAAVRTGMHYLLERDFSHVLFLDGDGQHNPEDIPLLIQSARSTGAGIVIGARSFDRARMPVERYYSNRMGSRVASWLAGQEVLDSQSGFRLIRVDQLRRLHLKARRYEIEMEILIKMSRAGCRIEHVPVQTIYHDGGPTKMKPVRDTLRICLCSLAFRWGK